MYMLMQKVDPEFYPDCRLTLTFGHQNQPPGILTPYRLKIHISSTIYVFIVYLAAFNLQDRLWCFIINGIWNCGICINLFTIGNRIIWRIWYEIFHPIFIIYFWYFRTWFYESRIFHTISLIMMLLKKLPGWLKFILYYCTPGNYLELQQC